MLRLAVTVVGEVLELSANAKAANVFLGCLGWNLQLFGNSKIGPAVELWRKVVEKCLSDNGLTILGGGLCGGQRAENFGGVLQKRTSHSDGCLKIRIVAAAEV